MFSPPPPGLSACFENWPMFFFPVFFVAAFLRFAAPSQRDLFASIFFYTSRVKNTRSPSAGQLLSFMLFITRSSLELPHSQFPPFPFPPLFFSYFFPLSHRPLARMMQYSSLFLPHRPVFPPPLWIRSLSGCPFDLFFPRRNDSSSAGKSYRPPSFVLGSKPMSPPLPPKKDFLRIINTGCPLPKFPHPEET